MSTYDVVFMIVKRLSESFCYEFHRNGATGVDGIEHNIIMKNTRINSFRPYKNIRDVTERYFECFFVFKVKYYSQGILKKKNSREYVK